MTEMKSSATVPLTWDEGVCRGSCTNPKKDLWQSFRVTIYSSGSPIRATAAR